MPPSCALAYRPAARSLARLDARLILAETTRRLARSMPTGCTRDKPSIACSTFSLLSRHLDACFNGSPCCPGGTPAIQRYWLAQQALRRSQRRKTPWKWALTARMGVFFVSSRHTRLAWRQRTNWPAARTLSALDTSNGFGGVDAPFGRLDSQLTGDCSEGLRLHQPWQKAWQTVDGSSRFPLTV